MSTLLMLTGPAGSGKSTAAAAWAASGTSPRALIDGDDARIWAGAAHPEHGWTQETQRQWDVAMDLWRAMARVYKRHEIDCVIDIYAPPGPPEDGDNIMIELGIRRVVLLPTFEVCATRNRARNRQPLLKDDDLRTNYDDFAWCVRRYRPKNVIDSSALTVDETVATIERVLHDPG